MVQVLGESVGHQPVASPAVIVSPELMSGQPSNAVFRERTLDELSIEDERSFRHVGLYADLKEVLRQSAYRFRVMAPSAADQAANWDRALLLNLTFWRPEDGGDLLVDETIPADVVAHVAWHHLAAAALAGQPGEPPSVQALFMGEAIASAFDIYLVGRLLGHAPDSSFLETQVPAMKETAEAAGVTEEAFEALLRTVAEGPERAFADLRELLFDATNAVYASRSAAQAWTALARLDGHRFAPLLHRYELSNWVLYARAYGVNVAGEGEGEGTTDAQTRALDATLRQQSDPLEWLSAHWVRRK